MNVGTVYRRVEPQDDEWDSVVIRGWYGGEGELREVVVAPITHGPCISTAPESLRASYRPVSPEAEAVEASIEGFSDRLEDLAAAQHG